jgi:polyhydroxybutyrate depolymerase
VSCLRFALALAAGFASLAAASAPAPGDHEFPVQVGGAERRYIVHVPAKRGLRPALVLNFHGGGSNPRQYRDYVQMDRLADRAGFVVVYPYGSGPLGDRLLTWNAGSCCGWAMRENVDDVAFVRVMLADLATRVGYDPRRVYATGMSNGAMMSYRLAVELPQAIAAIAPVAGAMVLTPQGPLHPMPVLHIHSTDDPRALYAGGLGPPFPLTNMRVLHPSVESQLALWARANGCSGPLEATTRREWTDAEGRLHTATLLHYTGCRVETALWRLSGAGHVWPGGQLDHFPRLLGPGTRVIDANVEVWKFFQRHRLEPGPGTDAGGLETRQARE